jgi:hypothetical protein
MRAKLITENPNAIIDPKVWEKKKQDKSYTPSKIEYNTFGSVPFGYYGADKILITGHPEQTHYHLFNKASKRGLITNNSLIKERGENSGRLFKIQKIITFWNFPEDYNELIKVLNDLEKDTKFNIINDPEWKVEIPSGEFKNAMDSNKSSWGSWHPRIGHQDFISIKDYKGGFQRSEDELAQQHVFSPMDPRKKKKVPKSWETSKPNDLKRLKLRQAMYAESYYPRLNK